MKKLHTSLTNEQSFYILRAGAERGLSLINIICTMVRNRFTVDHISVWMAITSLGKEFVDWIAIPFVMIDYNYMLAKKY